MVRVRQRRFASPELQGASSHWLSHSGIGGGQDATALSYAERAVELRRQLLQRSPIASSRKSLVVALNYLSEVKLRMHKSDEVKKIWDEQLSILQSMIDAQESAAEMQIWLDEIRIKLQNLNGL